MKEFSSQIKFLRYSDMIYNYYMLDVSIKIESYNILKTGNVYMLDLMTL